MSATSTPTMRDEQEISGASENARDAPTLAASRESGRRRRPTTKLTESQAQYQLHSPPGPQKRKRKAQFTVHQDPPAPPQTQKSSNSTPPASQIDKVLSKSQQKRRRTNKKQAEEDPPLLEQWELDFNATDNSQTKFQVLLQALGKENFPKRMRIPERRPKTIITEELDPLNPLWLWSKLVSPEVLQIIAKHTNEYESIQFEGREHSDKERGWKELTGADIGAYVGTAMLMGVHPQPSVDDYWNCSEDKPIFPIQKYTTRQRFQQISPYLKVNSPHDELGVTEFFHKVEPLMSSLRDASQKLILLPSTVSIDENLIAAQTRTIHLIQIDNKAAGKGFKIYTLACGSYLYDWIYTSKAAKVPQASHYVPQAEGYDTFTDTERMVLTLVRSMLDSQPAGTQF